MRKRSNIVVTYLSDIEKRQMDRLVRLSGLSQQMYGLKALTGQQINPRSCEHHLLIQAELSRLSNSAGETLRKLRENGQLTQGEIAELKGLLSSCWKHIRDCY